MDLRVLVVCPEQEASSLLATVFAEMNMLVDETPSYSRGLELLGEHRFDVVVLDYHADPASEEFLARLQQSSLNWSAMLVAVLDAEFNARPVFGLGAHFVLYRPLTAERTRTSLDAALGILRQERRKSARTRVSSPATVSYPGVPDEKATLVDIGDGGTLVTTRNVLPYSGKVYFEFKLPGQKEVVRLSGEVAWQDASGRSGVRFMHVPQASRRLIESWLKRNGVQGDVEPKLESAVVVHSQIMDSPGAESQTMDTQIMSSETMGAQDGVEEFDAAQKQDAQSGNRRGEERVPCQLGAEVYRAGTTIPNRCAVSDISEGGCYLEMPSPMPGRSQVEIVIHTAETKFKISGQVLSSHPGFGMGVRFLFNDARERKEVMKLLTTLSAEVASEEQAQ